LLRHAAADRGAAPAGLFAELQLLVVAEAGAALRGLQADVRADSARLAVLRQAEREERGVRPADLGATEQELQVLRGGVRAAAEQAVPDGLQTGHVALLAHVDAPLHLLRRC